MSSVISCLAANSWRCASVSVALFCAHQSRTETNGTFPCWRRSFSILAFSFASFSPSFRFLALRVACPRLLFCLKLGYCVIPQKRDVFLSWHCYSFDHMGRFIGSTVLPETWWVSDRHLPGWRGVAGRVRVIDQGGFHVGFGGRKKGPWGPCGSRLPPARANVPRISADCRARENLPSGRIPLTRIHRELASCTRQSLRVLALPVAGWSCTNLWVGFTFLLTMQHYFAIVASWRSP